jgi:carboxypeptidase C (cathepsin A)
MRHWLLVVSILALVAARARAQEAPRPEAAATTPPAAGDQPARPAGAARRATSRAPDEPGRGDVVETSGQDQRAERARSAKISDSDIATAPIHEIRRVTHHTVTIGGRPISYAATAGTLTIRDDDGAPTASMFYVAYTAGGEHGGRRPVTFFYNGGPGSSTLWLHMGSLGPMRVRTDSPEATRGPPFTLIPNDQSLLDKSDLVFIDAIGAGFSRPLGDTKLQTFWGTDPDIDAFARGIERYLTVYDRWNAPKFIFGESYGTTRSAGLSYRLQQDGAQLNGVILLSSILNYGRRSPGFDRELINYVPTYAATAAYHNRLQSKPADLPAFLKEVRSWAEGPYALALAKGQDLDDANRQQVAAQLSAYTGISVRYILDNDLRIEPGAFRKELLRDQRRTLGRYDARFEGIDVSAGGETPEFDASDTGITGAFVSSFYDYLSRELDFHTDLVYRPTYYNSKLTWSFEHRPPGARGPGGSNMADVALDLSAAMRENPHLLVYSLNGVYDFATPFFGTEYDLGHMQLDRSLKPNLRFAYYPSGHMVYLNTEALKAMKADLARFYDEAANGL